MHLLPQQPCSTLAAIFQIPFGCVERLSCCDRVCTGDQLKIDVAAGLMHNLTTKEQYQLKPLGEIAPILDAGGVFHLRRAEGRWNVEDNGPDRRLRPRVTPLLTTSGFLPSVKIPATGNTGQVTSARLNEFVHGAWPRLTRPPRANSAASAPIDGATIM